jgi:hypothetical protein
LRLFAGAVRNAKVTDVVQFRSDGIRQFAPQVVFRRLNSQRAQDVALLGQGDHRECVPVPLGVICDQKPAFVILDDGQDCFLFPHESYPPSLASRDEAKRGFDR